MKNTNRLLVSILLTLAVTLTPLAGVAQPVLAAAGCISSSPASGTYNVTICFTNPLDGSTLIGNANVTVDVTVTGSNPGVQRVIIYLNNSYVLTDYQTPYSFTLPTTLWVDGGYTISAEAMMRDNFITQRTDLTLNFNNGITSLPVNNNQFQPSTGITPQNGAPFVVAAAGDGAGGDLSSLNVTNLIASQNPNLFLYLGDVYEKGTETEFYNWYGTQTTNFGRFRSITNPTIGNHEYENGAAPGYFNYWDNIPNYYSFDAGGWHFVSLNSNSAYSPAYPNSAQYQWLEQDLVDHEQSCTIAFYHHPVLNIGSEGSSVSMRNIWRLLAQHDVSIVLNGHDHTYQRWVPLNGYRQPSPTGITEFVAGASGHGLQSITKSDTRVAYSNFMNPEAFGVLLLTLNPSGANFNYMSINGISLDSGVVPCVKAGPDGQHPSVPAKFSAAVSSPTRVNLKWLPSNDNTGVSGYTIYRNGATLAALSGINLSYTDDTVMPSTAYQYQVDAFDPAGNHSAESLAELVTMPKMPPELTFPVEADTYVSESSPASNYGSATDFSLDGSPNLHAYLRFTVQGLGGTPITRARLMVYTNNNSKMGISAITVPNNNWNEAEVNYSNAPALGSTLKSSGAITAGSWVTLDVTPYVTGEGTYSFGLTSPGTSMLTFQSRELGANVPQLILDLQNNGPDTESPTIPAGLTANAGGPTQVSLKWNASTDNVGVTGYTVFRNGIALTSVSATTLSYMDNSSLPETTYRYTIDAFDLAGNHSRVSAIVPVTTPGIPSSLAFTPDADTFVNVTSPTANYGLSKSLRVDASPDVHSYLRFNVQGLGGLPVKRARLLIYPTSFSTEGLNVQVVSESTWSEKKTNYYNAPPQGAILSSSPPVSAGTWVELNVTPSITGEGLYSFSITTSGLTAISFASRESGATSPQLIIDLK